ncbi:MAG: 6-phosphofructokinase, partial [Oscillospiraceae bacterium]|nr:6-phosphofructokinase [Oscillospiraceae bacterium]
NGGKFSIIAIAEGALTKEEAELPRKEKDALGLTAGSRLSSILSTRLDQEVRAVIPGHFQRGGEPTPTDRVLCSRFGAKAGELVSKKEYGYMVALKNNEITAVPLEVAASRTKAVPLDFEMLKQAKHLGISLGK